jgi:hypothetical protein
VEEKEEEEQDDDEVDVDDDDVDDHDEMTPTTAVLAAPVFPETSGRNRELGGVAGQRAEGPELGE